MHETYIWGTDIGAAQGLKDLWKKSKQSLDVIAGKKVRVVIT